MPRHSCPNVQGERTQFNLQVFTIMAKSKSGGTRSMIRGRVGSDVYSIGKDAKGKRQQVVRSLAETVANPQTLAQMRNRMIMSTVMQACSALKSIIDHSFDNVTGVQPNLSEFIRRNYALIKADVAAHPASGNAFGLVAYGEKGAKQGAYIVSDGKAAFPVAITFVQGTGVMTIALDSNDITFGGLKSKWEVGNDGYLTIVGISVNGVAEYARLHLASDKADSLALSGENIESCFNIEGDDTPSIALSGSNVVITLASVAGCSSVIVTRKTNNGYIHSKAVLGASVDLHYTADEALPTYPVGTQKFLNGGDSAGAATPSVAPDVPTPTPSGGDDVDAHMTSFTVAGQNALTGSFTMQTAGSKAVSGVLGNRKSGKTYAIAYKTGGQNVQVGETLTDNAKEITGTNYSDTVNMQDQQDYAFALTEDTKVIQVLAHIEVNELGDGN